MNTEGTVREVWQAFSILSDAQELIGVEEGERASDHINHAKRHLMVVLEAARVGDEPAYRAAIFSITTCTLEEGGH